MRASKSDKVIDDERIVKHTTPKISDGHCFGSTQKTSRVLHAGPSAIESFPNRGEIRTQMTRQDILFFRTVGSKRVSILELESLKPKE